MLEHIILSKATNVVDWDGVFYDKSVLDVVKENYEVRVHMYVNDDSDLDGWDYESDSPYLLIHEVRYPEDSIDGKSVEFLGEVTRRYRFEDDLKYPVRAGERIWFRKENIIEIPSKFQNVDEQRRLQSFKPDKTDYIPITGPLYLVQYPNSDDDSDYSNSTDSLYNSPVRRGRRG